MGRKQKWGRAGREKAQQKYKSDQVSLSRQQEEHEMSAVKAEAKGTGRAEEPAVESMDFQQKIIFKTTYLFKAFS